MANNEQFDVPGVVETIEADFNNETGEVTLFIRWKFEEEKIERKFPSWENLCYEEMKSFVKKVDSQRKNQK